MINGVKQEGKLSPILFNVYMDDSSVQLHATLVGFYSCDNGGQSPDLCR